MKPLPNTTINTTNAAFYADAITSSNTGHWSELFGKLYAVNAAIEGINSTTASLFYKDQWLGESYFTRALLYYFLVNMYGDLPLAVTTDYTINNKLSRAPQSQVYQQIIADLKEAQRLLNNTDYTDGYGKVTTLRVRPNGTVATALLAKMYLYTQEWANAEAAATSIINNAAYKLETPARVFLAGSQETIWALATNSTSTEKQTYEYDFYNKGMPANITTAPNTAYSVLVSMNSLLLNAFETNDARYSNWVRATTYTPAGGTAVTYYFPNKYKSGTGGAERTAILRLADIHLVRAEARARQNNVTGANSAATDVNIIRSRAGLGVTTAATQTTMLGAIAKERQIELFSECGSRFFDLKRTGAIDSVMTVVAPKKGGTWSSFKQLWPIAPSEIELNGNLTLNPGY
ncbi:MAG TPA: RagB/SusD family nutrient uptake outer membrane protein [Niastella sp.]